MSIAETEILLQFYTLKIKKMQATTQTHPISDFKSLESLYKRPIETISSKGPEEKDYLFLASFCVSFSYAQFESVSAAIIDDLHSLSPQNVNTRSKQNPKSCDEDTLEYARLKGTTFNALSVFDGFSLGQY